MKKIFFLMCITLVLLTSNIVYSDNNSSILKGKSIVLDAGHGGKDGGTSVNGISEKNINLQIVLKLQKALNKHGVDVILTRDGDFDLSSPNVSRRKKSDFDNRISLINNSDSDLYLSIHVNYLEDSRFYGAQTFYTIDNEELAQVIQGELKKNLKSPMNVKKISNSIYMYKQLTIPGVLIEVGFLSNFKERDLLIDENYQDKIVDSIIKGLINYFYI
ncbi:MAG: N-acetylmuramoyl-L-alanine amidase [Candidatus Coprovivens sp.]